MICRDRKIGTQKEMQENVSNTAKGVKYQSNAVKDDRDNSDHKKVPKKKHWT